MAETRTVRGSDARDGARCTRVLITRQRALHVRVDDVLEICRRLGVPSTARAAAGGSGTGSDCRRRARRNALVRLRAATVDERSPRWPLVAPVPRGPRRRRSLTPRSSQRGATMAQGMAVLWRFKSVKSRSQ